MNSNIDYNTFSLYTHQIKMLIFRIQKRMKIKYFYSARSRVRCLFSDSNLIQPNVLKINKINNHLALTSFSLAPVKRFKISNSVNIIKMR
jgi:hypothetical protein